MASTPSPIMVPVASSILTALVSGTCLIGTMMRIGIEPICIFFRCGCKEDFSVGDSNEGFRIAFQKWEGESQGRFKGPGASVFLSPLLSPG
jgi:hypothetical protein